jgi:hypothetical protein
LLHISNEGVQQVAGFCTPGVQKTFMFLAHHEACLRRCGPTWMETAPFRRKQLFCNHLRERYDRFTLAKTPQFSATAANELNCSPIGAVAIGGAAGAAVHGPGYPPSRFDIMCRLVMPSFESIINFATSYPVWARLVVSACVLTIVVTLLLAPRGSKDSVGKADTAGVTPH